MKRLGIAMIIALALLGLTRAASGADARALPDPVSFATALEAGNTLKAVEWLDAGLPPDFLGSRIGTGLMIGAWEGNIELMQIFLSRGADINRLNTNGESALALAAWKGRLESVKFLLERGARINAGNRQWSALHYAVFAGHREVMQYLLERGADINARSTNGSSVLMMAIYEGHEDLVRDLLEKGADRAVKNDWGDGGLEWAMRFERLKIARMITSPEEFNIAISEPKDKWGEARRSLALSPELEKLLRDRETLVAKGMSVKHLDDRIAAERARIVRKEFNRQALPPRAATMQVTTSRKNVKDQSARIVYDEDGKQVGFKVPPPTYTGTPKMPPKGPVKNY